MLLGVWISAPLEITFDNSERQSGNCSSNNIVLAHFHQIQHLWNATFEPRLTCKSVFLCKIKLYSLVFGYNSCSSFRVMPFVGSLKHAYVLEKFIFTPSTSSCFVVFSMCQLSAFWMAVLRSSRNLPFYWKCSVQLAWRTLTTFNNRSPTVTRTCVHVREWKVISLMSEFFLLFWCYVWTKQTTPIHSQFFYLIFFHRASSSMLFEGRRIN